MATKLGDREMDLLQALWELGAPNAGEVQQHLAKKGQHVAYTTVQTMLNRLETKGHLRRVLDGRAYRYEPVTKPQTAALQTVVKRFFHGSSGALAAHLVEAGLKDDDLDKLQSLIDEARKKR